jgi:hypothetical protein
MIQRKQSLFLFVAVVLLLISMFSVTTVFTSESDKTTVEFSNFSCSTYFDDVESKTIISNVPQENKQQNPDVVVKSNYLYSVFAIMLFVSAVISVVAIILFKNRGKQMRLCNWAVFVILIYYIARYSCIISISNKFDYTFNVNVSDFFPLIALVLIVMARVAINKDDKLVKAADRIR